MQGDDFDAAARKERLRIAYQNTFRGEDGELVLHDLIQRHQVFSPRYPGGMAGMADGTTMAIQNAWYEGRRSVPLEILGMLNTTVNEAVKIQKELMNAMGGPQQRMERALSDTLDD